MQPPAIDFDLVGTDKAGISEKHVNASPGRHRHRVVAAADGAHLPHASHDCGEIDPGRGAERVAELLSIAGLIHRPGRAEQRLARGAAEVDAGAAGQVPLGQGDAVPGLRGGDRGGQTARPTPDHHQFVNVLRAWWTPVGRMALGDRPAICRVERHDAGRRHKSPPWDISRKADRPAFDLHYLKFVHCPGGRALPQAARDIQRFTGDTTGLGRREEHDRRRDVLRLADAAQRRLRFGLLAEIAFGYSSGMQRLPFR